MRGACRREAGLSLLEFTLVVIIFGILVVLAFERIAALRADMERAVVQHTVGAMKATLALEFAARVSRGEVGRVDELAGVNVLALMDPPPADYEPGAAYSDWGTAPASTWFYDATRRAVVYRAEHPGALPDGVRGPAAAWRAVVRGGDRDRDGTVEPGREPVTGVGLERVTITDRGAESR